MSTAKRIIRGILRIVASTASIIASALTILLFSRPSRRSLLPVAHGDQSCVILGNGPSLKVSVSHDGDLLKNKVLFCTNDFIDSPLFQELRPSIYVLMDPVYWNRGVSPRFQEMFSRYVTLFDAVAWPVTIILPTAARRWNFFLEVPTRNPLVSIRYINTTQISGPRAFRYWAYDRNLAMPLMHNVLVAAAYLSVHLGFTRVFLLGGDHSWFKQIEVGQDNILKIANTRVHDQQPASAPFFEDGEETRPYSMSAFFEWLANIFQGHREVSDYAKARGACIVNASTVSYIDAYERSYPSINQGSAGERSL